MRLRVRTVVVFLLTLGLLALFFRQTDPAAIWAETRQADPWFLLAALAATGLTYLLRAWRWQALLAPIGRTRFSVALRTTIIGFAASSLLPARAGEVLRPYLLARQEGLSATAAFATIILERLLDLATVLLLFAWIVFTLPPGVISGDPSELAHVQFWGALAGVASLAGLVLLFALAGHPERLGRLTLRIGAVLPSTAARKLAAFAETFAEGLAVMRQPSRLAVALLQSVPLWLSISAGIWLTSRAFHMTFPFSASFLITTVLIVGVAMPTPGAVGGFHVAYQFAVMTFFGVPASRAAGAAIVLHAISFLPVTIAGAILMAVEGITLTGAKRMAEGEPGTDPPPNGPTLEVETAPIAPLKRGAR